MFRCLRYVAKAKHYSDLKIKIHELKLLIRPCQCQRRLPVNNRAGGCYCRALWSVGHTGAVLDGGKFRFLWKHEACTCNATCAGSWGCVLLNLHTRAARLQEGPKIDVIGVHGRTNHAVLSAFKSTSGIACNRTSLESPLDDFVSVCG